MKKTIEVGNLYKNRESLNVWRVVKVIDGFAIVERTQDVGRMFRWSIDSLLLPVYQDVSA